MVSGAVGRWCKGPSPPRARAAPPRRPPGGRWAAAATRDRGSPRRAWRGQHPLASAAGWRRAAPRARTSGGASAARARRSTAPYAPRPAGPTRAHRPWRCCTRLAPPYQPAQALGRLRADLLAGGDPPIAARDKPRALLPRRPDAVTVVQACSASGAASGSSGSAGRGGVPACSSAAQAGAQAWAALRGASGGGMGPGGSGALIRRGRIFPAAVASRGKPVDRNDAQRKGSRAPVGALA